MRALVTFTLQRKLRATKRRKQLLGCSPEPGCLGCLAGFISTFFYLSNLFVSSFSN